MPLRGFVDVGGDVCGLQSLNELCKWVRLEQSAYVLRVKFEMPPKLVRVEGNRTWYILEEVVAIPKLTMHVILQIRRSIVSVTAVYVLRHPPGVLSRRSLTCKTCPRWPFVRQKVAMIWLSIPMGLGSQI